MHVRKKIEVSLAFGSFLVVSLATSCNGEVVPEQNCVPGESQACTCTDGSGGAQTCDQEGNGFEACICAGPSDGGPDDAGPGNDAGVTDAGVTPDAGANDDDGGVPTSDVDGIAIMHKLVGLWGGPTDSFTVVPDLPVMNMDLQAVDDRTLFSRQDLNDDNALRFSFSIESHNGVEQLVYRNGGFFLGATRDSRSVIESFDDATGVYRFCGIDRGCSYVDSIFIFDGDDALTFEVAVRGEPHIFWTATRLQTREVGLPFPLDETSTGTTDQDFVPMSSAQISVSWTDAAPTGANIAVAISAEPTPLTNPLLSSWSRNFLQPLAGGETSSVVNIEQLHAGTYYLNVVLDKDGNTFPSNGDVLQIPNMEIVIADDATQHAITSRLTIPVSF